MQIREMLMNRKSEIAEEIAKLRAEEAEIDRMLSVSGETVTKAPVAGTSTQSAGTSTQDDAIIDAVRAGNRRPQEIASYIREKLGVKVNDASIRTRLSRMKAAEKIKHDGFGWKID